MLTTDFLSLKETPRNFPQQVVQTAIECRKKRLLSRRTGNRLEGHSLAILFEKPSTRTRCSLHVGAFEEGAQTTTLDSNSIHTGSKEELQDTAQVLSRYYSAIAWRGHSHDRLLELAKHSSIPVLNMLSESHHPTQALADVMTLQEEFGSVVDKKVCYLGDTTNNVARSLCEAADLFGFQLTLCGPTQQAPLVEPLLSARVKFEADPAKASSGAHALYTDVWTSMGADKTENEDALYKPYQVTRDLMHDSGRDDTIFLHCLPAVRGKEVTTEVMDSAKSRVFQQAENRLHTIKALLIHVLNPRVTE